VVSFSAMSGPVVSGDIPSSTRPDSLEITRSLQTDFAANVMSKLWLVSHF
jgi:hypothetical protein